MISLVSRYISLSNMSVRRLGCLFCLFACAVTAWPQGNGHTLRGKVYIPTGAPTQKAVRVQLLSRGAVLAEAYTDASGSYAFTNVADGSYQLVAEGDERTYERTILDIEISFISANRVPQIITRNITLMAKTEELASIPPGEVNVSVPKDAKKKYEKGVKSSKGGKSQEAIENFQEAVKLHPDYFDAYLALGEECTKLRNFPAAHAAFSKAILIKPKLPQGHASLGMVLVKSGEHNAAVPVLREALELGGRVSATYLFLGVALMETGIHNEAEEMMLKALELSDDQQPGIHLFLSNLYNRMGNRDKTLKHLEAYVQAAPTAPNVEEIQKLIKRLKEQK
ncbi:MAG: tetratricopeptide repeat protein [Acidobacteriota bacterium]